MSKQKDRTEPFTKTWEEERAHEERLIERRRTYASKRDRPFCETHGCKTSKHIWYLDKETRSTHCHGCGLVRS